MNLAPLYDAARWIAGIVLRSPAEKAALAALDENTKFLTYVAGYPRFKELEAANAAAARAMGVGLTVDPASGHVQSIYPPPAPPQEAGGRPDGTNRGGLMPPGT